jgi:pentatricopeptide repeat protein
LEAKRVQTLLEKNMNQMVCALSSLSPSASPSPLASHRGLCLFCYASPQYRFLSAQLTNKPNFNNSRSPISPETPIQTNFFGKIWTPRQHYLKAKQDDERWSDQEDDISARETLDQLNHLCKQGQTEKAIDLLDMMISKGFEPDGMTYRILINGLCKKDEIEKAMEFLNVMISKGLEPDIVTYNPLINGLCRKGEIEKAMSLLDEMI